MVIVVRDRLAVFVFPVSRDAFLGDPVHLLRADLELERATTERGHAFHRFQQVLGGVPVLAGEVVVQVDASGAVEGVHGHLGRASQVGGFGATQSTILALKALIAFTRENKKAIESGNLSLFVNGPNQAATRAFQGGTLEPITLKVAGNEPPPPQIGWTEEAMLGLAILEIIAAILYLVPFSAMLGAVLITAYLGGASGGVAFGLRDFWQRHPTALDLRNAHTDLASATVWFYSPEAPAM